MKKLFAFIVACMLSVHAFSQTTGPVVGNQIEWETHYGKPLVGGVPLPKSPILSPIASIDDHTLYLYDVDYDLTLYLLDEDGETVYSVVVPAGTPTVVLPATLTGDFTLQLYPGGNYYFEGEITL